ncbi:hypothetical protein RDWZM_000686 [Blomia tropicalis]|uniref:Uncharacterized protein n=1 Tax=Blomia tropicalis TaxID=40697 RepID=A0A9Q0RPW7_BLOTA|nr:hypothetical protein RDWZM_000686 [Blomia tropicalis]
MQMPEWKKILILVVGLLEILIFSGTILGWTSLKLMLKKEGIYDYKCRRQTNITNENNNNNNNNLPLSSNLVNETLSSNQTIGTNEMTITKLPTALANISLQLNFTIESVDHHDDNRKLSSSSLSPSSPSSSSSSLSSLNTNTNGNSLKRTIVIPFQSAQPYNQSFIYTLLRDSSVVLRSNRSDVELNLYSDTFGQQPKDNVSTLEQFIHLYMAENLEPVNTLPDDTCNEQEVTLNLAFSIGSFCMGAAAFIWGFLLERWGLRIVRLFDDNDWCLSPMFYGQGYIMVLIDLPNVTIGKKSIIDRSPHKNSFFSELRQMIINVVTIDCIRLGITEVLQ